MQIYVTDRNGDEHVLEGALGEPLMHSLAAEDLVEATCGGSCSCATCHLHIDEQWLAKLPHQGEDEVELVECLPAAKPGSRLACQLTITEDLDGIRVTVAPEAGF
ncbi:MAG: 2Fe-2S iron-sulfur cluster-binding protein [Pseudomonadota bacterium]